MRRLGILGVVRGQRPFTTISDPALFSFLYLFNEVISVDELRLKL